MKHARRFLIACSSGKALHDLGDGHTTFAMTIIDDMHQTNPLFTSFWTHHLARNPIADPSRRTIFSFAFGT